MFTGFHFNVIFMECTLINTQMENMHNYLERKKNISIFLNINIIFVKILRMLKMMYYEETANLINKSKCILQLLSNKWGNINCVLKDYNEINYYSQTN